MNEFFRTYGKWVLAVLGVVLMVMWVMPTGGQNSNRNSDYVVGRANGKKVYQSELREANNQVEILQRFVTAALREYGAQNEATESLLILVGSPTLGFKGEINERNPALHYHLLTREAREMGMLGTEDDAFRLIRDGGLNEANFQDFCERASLSQKGVRRVLAEYAGVAKARDLAQQAISVSVPEVEHVAMNEQSSVAAAYVALSAENPPESVHAPLSADIARQFETYKDIALLEARKGPKEIDGHRFPFGYKYPDRVKVEYLKIPWDAVRAQVLPKTAEDRAADQEAAWAYYKEHEREFATTAPATVPATTAAPATTSAPAAATTKPFTEVRAKLVDAQIDGRGYAKIREIAERAMALASEPFKQAGGTADKRPELKPEAWIAYATIAGKIGQTYSITPERSSAGPWLTAEGLEMLPGIGKAGLPTPSGQVEPFVMLALNVREITPTQSGLALRLQLERGAEGPVLFDEAHNAYVYRVVEAEKSHAPANADEVRDQVVLDLRRVAYFKERMEQAKGLVAEAEKDGMGAVAEKVGSKVMVTPPFQRKVPTNRDEAGHLVRGSRSPAVEGLGVVPAFTEAAFGLAQKVGRVDHATSQPGTQAAATAAASATLPAKVRPAATVAFEPNLTVYVLQVDSYHPLAADAFEFKRRSEAQRLTYMDQFVFAREWGGLKAVAARLKYVSEGGADLEKE